MFCPKDYKPCPDDVCHGAGCIYTREPMLAVCEECGGFMNHDEGNVCEECQWEDDFEDDWWEDEP